MPFNLSSNSTHIEFFTKTTPALLKGLRNTAEEYQQSEIIRA